MIVAEGIVREDHGDLLAEIAGDPRRHGTDLRADVGDARLKDIAVQHAGSDVIALAHHEIRHLEFAGARRRTDHDMREQRAEDEVDLVLAGEFLDHLGAALGVRAVILGDDFDLATGNAASFVDQLRRGLGGAVVPAAITGADAGAVQLEAQPQRFRCLRLGVADIARRKGERTGGTEGLEGGTSCDQALFSADERRLLIHSTTPCREWVAESTCFNSVLWRPFAYK